MVGGAELVASFLHSVTPGFSRDLWALGKDDFRFPVAFVSPLGLMIVRGSCVYCLCQRDKAVGFFVRVPPTAVL